MKCSKAAIHRKTHRIPEIKFEDQRLTSFACCCRSKTAVICRCPEVAAGDNATSAEVYAVMAPGC